MNISTENITRIHRFTDIEWFEVLTNNTVTNITLTYSSWANRVTDTLWLDKFTNTKYITSILVTHITSIYNLNRPTLMQMFYRFTNIKWNKCNSTSDIFMIV